MKWLRKLYLGQYAQSNYYWKLKDLLGKDFTIEYTVSCGSMIRNYGIQLKNTFDEIKVSSNFEFMGNKEMIKRIDDAFKEIFEEITNE